MSRTAINKTTGHAPSTLMLERMREAATDLAILASTMQGWKFANERNGAMLYEMAGRNLPQNVSTARKFGRGAGHSADYFLVRAVTTVHSGVAPMLDLLHSTTTEEFRLVMRQIFSDYFQHGVTLDKLTCTTPPPFAEDHDAGVDGSRRSFSEDDAYSVNWLTLKAQAKLETVENNRDFTLVCYQDAFYRHESGVLERVGRGTARARSNTPNHVSQSRLMGVHVLSSVNFQDVPELSIPDCTDRLHFRNSGFVIEETSEPNVLRLSLLLSLLPTKATLKYVRKYQRWLHTLASCVGNLAQILRPEITMHCLNKLTWKQSDHCFMCLKMFRTFRRCHHCRFCGEAVCNACSSMINMSGYDVKDSSHTLITSAAISLASSQYKDTANTDFSQTRDARHLAPADEKSLTRNSSFKSRGHREARGCNACIADLRHGLTASVALKLRRNSDSDSNTSGDNSFFARSQNGLSTSYGDDDLQLYDSPDEISYERRLGSVATFIKSDNGPGTIVEEDGPFTASILGLIDPEDQYSVTPEEMQDKFPAVDEAAPPRFRTVSNPDQLRRMRDGLDSDLPQRLKDKHSMVSMSTASSSFSRSSNDRYTNENVSQYSRGTNFTTMSDGFSAGDLSHDPDILALAGLSMNRKLSDDFESEFVQRQPMSDSETYEHLSSHVYVATDSERETGTEIVDYNTDKELSKKAYPNFWHESSHADSRCRSTTTSTRDDNLNTLRPADVLRHRSHTSTSVLWNSATTASLSSSSTDSSRKFGSSSNMSIKMAEEPAEPPDSSCDGKINFLKLSSHPLSHSTAAIEAVVTATPANSAEIDRTSSSNDENTLTLDRQNSASVTVNGWPVPIPEDTSTSDRNDMIPLPQSGELPVKFVVFSDSRRKSIFTRADDGQDMIPLDF
ncbi:Phosphatidylinositol-4-phosphate 5-kinase and related FYVE finger-containing proteins [Plasmopara halstedii]|uniref:Phosphatidylinositol-4-phosphate 5-kinase and related FYVE finger-containing proteins n=1 Tax=Plasmopara halstedii TaxID=4781 RepID=A0A0P1AHE3_PLAHL|nr:Phosphatidylinositol-4-phosphate 5-kinase and related FYVE finger-containing proteins [Plasmopara halstedii]CEG39896.1 Phosphatidylinositol-4-phosphate 5-kinase and related FYVE finger-containing proteins [Plasmopara halstedii]|eukprot:XP_024576265.1 Phosphatidylinositol-4-phosphate 5-kinase and related FYVE finger-containing proteins [Plasmopara halstedii]